MTLTIQVSKEQAQALADEMGQRGFEVLLEDDQDFVVPQWHIDEVRRRRALKDQPAPKLWSEIRKQFVERGLL
jgi:hypothetical protein